MKTAPDRELPDRAAGYGLLASAVVAMLPHLGRLPWWLTLYLTVLFTWRLFMLRRSWPAPGRWLRLTLVALGIVAVYRHYGTILGRDAGSALLATMLALKFLELRRLRDYMLALFLIYFLIVVGFLYSQDVWLVLYLLAVFVATTATLVRVALPGVHGRRALRIALVLLAQALPLMLVMHLLFPRLQGALWGLPRDAFAGRTGLSEQLQPGSINQLSLSDEVAFRAYFPEAVPKPAERYWRTLVLTHTDGRTWTRAPGVRATPGFEPEGPALPYLLALEPSGKPWIPVLELPVRWPANLSWRHDFTLVAAQPIEQRQVLDFDARLRYRARTLRDDERRAALAQPPPSARVQALARRLRTGRDEDTIQAALAYFRREPFFYTLEPPLLGADPTDEFLFDTRRGFCEHYAAAFVVLMRAAGLPARLVTGYQGGEFNRANRSLIVRQADAHAWAEVWLAERGWTRVDPTAAVAPERIDYGAEGLRRLLARGGRPGTAADVALELDWLERLRRDSRLALDAVQSAWQRWVLGYDTDRQRALLTRFGFGDVGGARLVGLLALIVALVIAVYVFVNRPRPPPLDPVQRLYLRLCRKLARAGLVRAAHEGPSDFFARVARARPDLAPALPALVEHYLRLRYGHDQNSGLLADFASQVALFRPARR